MGIMKIKGAIFDLDGTLLDSMKIWDTIGEDYLGSIGKIPREDLREALRPMSSVQAAEYFITDYGVESSVQEIMDGIIDLTAHFYIEEAPAKKCVKDFLEQLKQNGVKMCIVTATDRRLAEAALERNRLLDYFETIFTCNEVGSGKDNPEIFDRAFRFLDTKKEETYIFEDALFAIRTAKNAGYRVVAVYDESAEGQQAEIRQLADITIQSFDEIM